MSGKVLLKAIYTFKVSHNDEVRPTISTVGGVRLCRGRLPSFRFRHTLQLNFKKGDVITLTQKEEGGWWEGTLDGKTGWFPSNYVKEVPLANGQSTARDGAKDTGVDGEDVRAKQIDYR